MQTNFYVFFGEISVEMRAAPGTGIVSCAILESDDLDEIDWEWLGGTSTQVETNYFGKGNTSTYDRETYVDMADSQEDFHNYTIVWTEEEINWKIDGTVVRTLAYADALEGQNYPQTPMRVKLGTWAGGDSSNSEGTIEWAGGATDYDDGPFLAYVKTVTIVNYNPAESYTYSDTTGSNDSIVLDGATDTTSSDEASSSTENHGMFFPSSLLRKEMCSVDAAEADGADSSAAVNGTISSTNSTSSIVTLSNSTAASSSGSSASSSSTSSSTTSSSTSTTVTTADAASWRPRMALFSFFMTVLALI